MYKIVKNAYYMSAGFAGRHVVGFGNFSIDVFLEVVNLVNLYMAHVASIIQNTARIPGVSVNAAAPVAGLHSSPLPCGKGLLASGCTRSDILKN